MTSYKSVTGNHGQKCIEASLSYRAHFLAIADCLSTAVVVRSRDRTRRRDIPMRDLYGKTKNIDRLQPNRSALGLGRTIRVLSRSASAAYVQNRSTAPISPNRWSGRRSGSLTRFLF